MATLVLPSENVMDDEATIEVVLQSLNQAFNPCVGAERGEKSSGVSTVEVKLEEKQVVEKSIFEWAPFDFPFPTQPYAGPGSFAHMHLRGRFQKDYNNDKNTLTVQFFDSIGIRIGQINLDPRTIIEVNKENCVDKDGYVKIFPIATDINRFDITSSNRFIIYAVKYSSETGADCKVSKTLEFCRYTSQAMARREAVIYGKDPFESFSKGRIGKTSLASTVQSTHDDNGMCACHRAGLEVFKAQMRFFEEYVKCEHRKKKLEENPLACNCNLFRERYSKILDGKAFLPHFAVGPDLANDAL